MKQALFTYVSGFLVCLASADLTAGFVASDPVPGSELASIFGGACQGKQENFAFCQGGCGGACDQIRPGVYIKNTATNAVKRWCANPAVSSKVCDCNQTGVPQSACCLQQTCLQDGTCNSGCNAATPSTTVQTTVNLNGQTCVQDSNCNG